MAAKVDNREAFQYHRDILPQFQSIYDPILETGLFSYVGYFRMYREKKFLFPIGNDFNIIENYTTNVLSCGSYYPQHCQSLQDISLVPWPERFSTIDSPLHYLKHLNIGSGVTLYKRFPNFIEGLYICPGNNTINLNALAADKSSCLQKIRHEVSRKASLILESRKKVFIHFQGLFNIDPAEEHDFIQEKMDLLLKKFKEDNFVDALAGKSNVSLTNRQVQTILASIHGQSSKEAAQKLNITYRTVEDHWATIHRKFQHTTGSVYSRSQIIETFLEEADTYLNTGLSRDLIQEIDKYRRSLMDLRRQRQGACLKERAP